MTFSKLVKKMTLPTMTALERKSASIMVVDTDPGTRQNLRQTLTSLGFSSVTDAPDHALALEKLEQRGVTHVIFEAKKSNMPAKEFLTKALEMDKSMICIPSSMEPSVDDVFTLLVIGARGYIVKPFSPEDLDTALVMATKGEAISDSILYAKDRNEALASLIMTSLDKLAIILRQAKQFETANREVPGKQMAFRRSVDIGKTFARGGPPELMEAILNFCVDRSNGPATRLGRIRKRLEHKKASDEPEVDVEESKSKEEEEAGRVV